MLTGVTAREDAAPVWEADGLEPEPEPEPVALPEPPEPVLWAAGRVEVTTAEVEVGAVAVPRVQVKYHP
jgi:hypothetical protein